MISREQFVEIVNKMKLVDDFVNETNEKVWQLRDALGGNFTDFFDSHTLLVAYDDIVVNLLENMFNDNDMISYWVYDLDFGRKYKKGYISDSDGKEIDLSSVEKLYDYLVEEMDKNIKLD